MQIRSALKTFFLCLYLLRAQILGFALLWPISGWVLQNPMFRGLSDLETSQLLQVESIAVVFIGFLVCTTNLVLLYGRDRMAEGPGSNAEASPIHPILPEGWIRWGIPLIGVLIGILFIQNVVKDWTLDKLVVSVVMLLGVGAFIVLWESFEKRVARIPQIFARVQTLKDQARSATRVIRVMLVLFLFVVGTLSLIVRGIDTMFRAFGPGYCRGGHIFEGHRVAVLFFLYFLLIFYVNGWYFGFSGKSVFGIRIMEPWETSGSTLLLALYGIQFAIGILTMLTFYFDRYRIPVILVLALLITGTSFVNNPESTFYARPVQVQQVDGLLSPKQVLANSPSRIIVVAAAGGGLQSSGWTAEVLAGLTEENTEFRRHLKVISGVSGGSVGTVFYLASYAGVWSEKAWNMKEVRQGATTSFLEDVAWGLVYPDLHRLVLPIPFWGNMDRGKALEEAFARTAKKTLDQTVLGMAAKVADGLPVIILNATLTDKALPVVFSNSRFPDPAARREYQRSIRSFWHDYRLDTRLETAARVSATFPYISPASRPDLLPGVDAFVDGGFFDNSGLYSLMAWLEQASEGLDPSEQREVLIIMIDAFPEPDKQADKRVNLQWYDQLLLPMTTVVGVRQTGQAARTKYEFPLLTRSLEPAMKVTPIQFRYTPSPRCALDPPPLSWRLTEFEKSCLAEGWSENGVRESRSRVKKWLETGRPA